MSGKQKQRQKTFSVPKPVNERDAWYFLAFFFILTFIYFFCFAGYLLFFQEQQNLFVYLPSFLNDYLVKPGGLLDLAGNFLTQFYVGKFAGSLIIAVILTLPGIILIKINKLLLHGNVLSQLIILLPSCFLLIMQMHYYHFMVYNLGFLLVFLYFLFSIFSGKKIVRYLAIALYPLFYYVAGAYALIFLCLFIIYNLIYVKGEQKYYYSLILLFLALISVAVSREFLFEQPAKQFLLFPLPSVNDSTHKALFYILTSFVILYPVLCKLTGSVNMKKYNTRISGIFITIIVFSSTIIMLVARFNSQTSRVVNLEKLVFEEKWNDVIRYQEKYPSGNLIGQYFYNIALSETDQLCDRLFFGRQDFGTGSLMLKWSSDYLNWGAFAFYTTGLVNEAQRWAYEEMVVYGCRPQNMKLLVKTSLLTGNYPMAEKYTEVLKHTLFYKSWADKYEKMAKDTSLILSDPELGKKIKILPRNDFFVSLESPEDNLPALMDENSTNNKAFEYLMSWLLLEKNIEPAVNNIKLMKNMGYKRIPRHIEEAALTYIDGTKKMPELGGLSISNETMARFNSYVAAYIAARQNPSTFQAKMQAKYGNTFWYYFQFGQPAAKPVNK